MASMTFINGGVSNGNIGVASNYDLARIPTSADDVTQSAGANATTGTATCSSWTNGPSALGGCTINGNVTLTNSLPGYSNLTIVGNVSAQANLGNGGRVTITGNLTLTGGSMFTITVNAGTTTFAAGSSFGGLSSGCVANGPLVFPGSFLGGTGAGQFIGYYTVNGGVKITGMGANSVTVGDNKAVDLGLITGITNVAAGNIENGVAIAGVTGTFTGSAGALAWNLASP